MADVLAHPWWAKPEAQFNPFWQSVHPVRQTNLFGPCTCDIDAKVVYLTVDQLKDIAKGATFSNILKHVDPLNAAMHKYQIRTPLRIAHFIAQVAHESGRFIYTREIASGAAYEGRKDLGNTQKGDGKRFRGRGLIQITGRANYTKYGTYVGKSFTDDTTAVQLEQEPWASDSAGWFWHVYKKLSPLADADNLLEITRRINGGYNGLADRRSMLARAKKVLNIHQKVQEVGK